MTVPDGFQLDLTGGESVYCINAFQMRKAAELAGGTDASAERVRAYIARVESDLTRNERAAVAMLLLQPWSCRWFDQ